MEHGRFRGFQSGNNREVPINPEALVVVKRKFAENDEAPSSCKRSASSSSSHLNVLLKADDMVASHDSELAKSGHVFSGFTTASNKKVIVSETALLKAKEKLAALDENEQPATVLSGFSTASNRKISVSEAAIAEAKKKLYEASDEGENCKPLPHSPVSRSIGAKPRGFISPMVTTINRMQINSPISPSPLTNFNSPVNCNAGRLPNKSSFRTPYKVHPVLSRSDDNTVMVTKQDPIEIKASTSWSDNEETADTNITNAKCHSDINTPMTPISTKTSNKTVDIISLNSYFRKHVDLMAVVSKSQQFVPVNSSDPTIKKACFELYDVSGRVFCDFFLRNPPNTVEVGSVILIQQAFVKEKSGKPSLIANCKSTVCFHVCSQVADSLRLACRRLAQRPQSSSCNLPATTNAEYGFDYGALKMIAKLDGYDKAFVKGYIHEVKCDSNIVYFGCSQCKVKFIGERCKRCDSTESRYYYMLKISIFDFSGSIKVRIFDPIATKLVGEDASEAAKLMKYYPDKFRQKLTTLEFSLPLVFKIVRNNDQWTVEDFTSVNFPTCAKFLRETVIAKKLPT